MVALELSTGFIGETGSEVDRMRSAFRSFAVAACLLVISTFGAADPITGSLTGLTTPTGTITFEQQAGLVNHLLVTDQYAGATFTGFGWDDGGLGQTGSTGFSGGALANGFFGWPTDQTMSITFDSIVNAAVFAAVDQGKKFTFSAYLNGNLVDTMTLPVSNAPGIGFIGFSNENFNMITISRHNTADVSAFSIDGLQFVTGSIEPPPPPPPPDPPPGAEVPEPASLILFGSGITSLAAILRRRRAI
jgi:hypothetical protein